MSHLISVYTMCPVDFEISVLYGLDKTFLNFCSRKFCQLLLALYTLKFVQVDFTICECTKMIGNNKQCRS